MSRRVTLALIGLTALASCATLNERECRRGDWYAVGLADGARGVLPDHIDRHYKACTKHGVLPDVALWAEGRRAGLPSYCTPAKAYSEGRAGKSVAPVCPATQAPALSRANLAGQKYFDLGKEISEARAEISRIDEDLDTIDPNDRPRRRALLRQREDTVHLVDHLQFERLRYGSWN